jgi:sensor c-di-GMP phosphodiesterase-like protein
MAKTLNFVIVAEGIETQEQLDYLRAHNVDLGQGWLFAKAMPVDEFIAYYDRDRQKAGIARQCATP